VDQPSVARQVQLTGAHAADRHPDRLQILAAIPCAFAAVRQLGEPRWVQLLVGRHKMIAKVLGRERSGDGRYAGDRSRGGRRAAPLQKGAAVDRPTATADGAAAGGILRGRQLGLGKRRGWGHGGISTGLEKTEQQATYGYDSIQNHAATGTPGDCRVSWPTRQTPRHWPILDATRFPSCPCPSGSDNSVRKNGGQDRPSCNNLSSPRILRRRT